MSFWAQIFKHVANRIDLPGYGDRASVSSKEGKTYSDASGNPVPNDGEVCTGFIGKDAGGKSASLQSVFQVVPGQKPLWSISRM